MKHCISISDFTKENLEDLFKTADSIKDKKDLCKGKIMSVLFYEPSTRTRLSFESAMLHLGGSVIGFADATTSSVKKGESISDTIRTIEQYADIAVIRHPIEGSSKAASQFVDIPIINAGDGGHEHPTQTLLDLYTIKKELKRIDGLTISLCGDLKYGRTTHSLLEALDQYNVKVKLVSPDILKMPKRIKSKVKIPIEEYSSLESALDADVVYMTRIQKERFGDPTEYERVKKQMVLTKQMAEKTHALIMHPLPRVNEIAPDVDLLTNAVYFKQAGYGVPIRMALIAKLLGVA